MACGVTETVPVDGNAIGMDQNAFSRALNYMNIQPASPIREQKIDQVFIGSCTNGRLEDLRSAAAILRGHKIADGVKMTVVPGSDLVKRQAEAEGLDKIFIEAGAEWHQSGCSLCLSMNGDVVEAGKTCVSTSNRNFEGRQGAGARTILASPATAAASAIFGRVSDPREIEAIHA
jgi:3-isopropylmalate/(R)-2-methylmalate dehydratase large subunit